jgi:anaerobic ribonucleoside-triphosphate reductase activating protein
MVWTKKKGENVSVYELYQFVDSISDEYDGITITGGEPFQQYEQLITFVYLLKTRTKLNVHCFTGYELKELETMYPDKLFMNYIDYLVDGRYVKKLHSNNGVVGSTNQKTFQIISNKAHEMIFQKENDKWSLNVANDGTIYMAGIPREFEIAKLIQDLDSVGIKKKFK